MEPGISYEGEQSYLHYTGQSCNEDSSKIYALLGHNRFLLNDARFIALSLYNRFFNYPFPPHGCPLGLQG